MKLKITLRIHLGNSIGRKFLSDHFRSWAKRPAAWFEHSVNVQLPILSAFCGDAGNLVLPVVQERNRNIYVHVQPMGTTMTSQMNTRHRDSKNIKGYKHTKPTSTLGKAVTMLNYLTSLKLFFAARLKLSDFQLYSAGLCTALLARWKNYPCKPFCMQVWSPSRAFTVSLLNWLSSLILTFKRLISCLGHFNVSLLNSCLYFYVLIHSLYRPAAF